MIAKHPCGIPEHTCGIDEAFAEHAQHLDDALRSVTQSVIDHTQDLIHDLAALEGYRRETDDAERRFWLHAAEQNWLVGPNEDARKLAKKNAYEKEGNQSPFHLHDRRRSIAQLEVEIETIRLRLQAYRDELDALKTRAALLPVLTLAPRADAGVQAGQGVAQTADLLHPARLAVTR